MLPGSLTPLETDLAGRFEPARVARHLSAMAAQPPTRLADYVLETLRAYDVSITHHQPRLVHTNATDVYFSLARRDAPVEAIALPYSSATPPEGVVAPLHIAARGTTPGGAILLLDAPPSPSAIAVAAIGGAAGVVYISDDIVESDAPDDGGHEAPIPAVAIGRAAGEGYLALAESGPVSVRLRVTRESRTETLSIPVAAIGGTESPARYIVAGTHGAPTGSLRGAATLLECCRVLASERARLRRGLRLLWWPANDRLGAAPQWYVGEAWHDLVSHAGAYVELDGAPTNSATAARIEGHPQWRWVAQTTAREAGIERVMWHAPPASPASAAFAAAGIPTIAPGYGVNAPPLDLLLLARLCVYPVPPTDLVGVARALESRVLEHAASSTEELDLGPLRARASTWRATAERLQLVALHTAQGDATNLEEGLELLREVTDRLNRLLVPLQFRAGDRYVPTPLADDLLPGLASEVQSPAGRRPKAGWEARLRERNRLGDALGEATRLANDALNALSNLGIA